MKIKKGGKIITLTESDIKKITKKLLSEQGYIDNYEDDFDAEEHSRNLQNKRNSIKQSWETLSKIASGDGECAELASALEIILNDIKDTSDRAMSNTWKD